MPPYFYISNKDRLALKKDIGKLSNELVRKYKAYGLDTHLFYSNSKIFGNWHIYEDYGNVNKCRIDKDNPDKISTTEIIDFLSKRAISLIGDVETKGKKSQNIQAILFVRNIYYTNKERYGQPLNDVIAIVTNAIFLTNYTESDIHKLCNR